MFNTLTLFLPFASTCIQRGLCLGVVKVLIPRQAGSVIPPSARKKWLCLVPEAMVIPAPLGYIKVVAVKSSAQAGSVSPPSQEEVGKSGASSHGNSSTISIY